MKKKASEIRVGDSLIVGGEHLKVLTCELSETSKQGAKKCRLEAQRTSGEKVVLIRPADYPLEVA